jgi:hypothetical protein
MVSGKSPLHLGKAEIAPTNERVHCHESLVAIRVFLRKLSRSPPIESQRGETLQRMILGQLPSLPDLVRVDRVLRTLEIHGRDQQRSVQLRHW